MTGFDLEVSLVGTAEGGGRAEGILATVITCFRSQKCCPILSTFGPDLCTERRLANVPKISGGQPEGGRRECLPITKIQHLVFWLVSGINRFIFN